MIFWLEYTTYTFGESFALMLKKKYWINNRKIVRQQKWEEMMLIQEVLFVSSYTK